MGADDKR
ncbi:rCG49611, partial [Rattus norvegicus]